MQDQQSKGVTHTRPSRLQRMTVESNESSFFSSFFFFLNEWKTRLLSSTIQLLNQMAGTSSHSRRCLLSYQRGCRHPSESKSSPWLCAGGGRGTEKLGHVLLHLPDSWDAEGAFLLHSWLQRHSASVLQCWMQDGLVLHLPTLPLLDAL